MKQEQALEILKSGANVFLTGEPGAGKTHTVNQYIQYLREHELRVAVTASTGIAATHLGGMTIHAWSGIGIKKHLSGEDLARLRSRKQLVTRAEKTSVLIIDEVSMLDGETLGAVDLAVRTLRGRDEPFGGLQVVLVGDFFQLPPVVRGNEEMQWAFQSPAWQACKPVICYIEEQHRQDDDAFLEVLSAMRRNQVTESIQEVLWSRRIQQVESRTITRLYTHNQDVDSVNERQLQQLQGLAKEYKMTTRGRKKLVEQLKKSCLSPELLKLKVGARVMFTKNSYEQGFVNGTLGEVVELKGNGPVVRTTDGIKITVSPTEWEINDGEKVMAKIVQYPLRLAWAMTVHKSQGMTLDAAVMDLSRTFEYGQGYVAISRVRSLSGLWLEGISKQALLVHPEIVNIDAFFKTQSEKAVAALRKHGGEEMERRQKEFIVRNDGSVKKVEVSKMKGPGERSKNKVPTAMQTLELFEKGMSLEKMVETRGLKEKTIVSHLEKLKYGGYVEASDLRRIIPKELKKDLPIILEAFDEAGDGKLGPVKTKMNNKYDWDVLQLARLVWEG